ncbi:MAG: class I SAM-dependent methyltransferase [Actinomycetota bacterium]|nr:class I SAM-dependent methyltransferase [Actinomycetota bacterium]
MSTSEQWEEHAEDWIRRARSEGHDHYFWRVSRPALLALPPAPGRLTIDVACGEGRLARVLRERGHHVVAVENSMALARAAREIARVLVPGGRLCASIVHPVRSAAEAPHYFTEHPYAETRTRGGLTMTFHDIHRPLEAYSRALGGAGFLIEALREPVPTPEHVSDWPAAASSRETPRFLVLRARKA